jgi:hypothetical protein
MFLLFSLFLFGMEVESKTLARQVGYKLFCRIYNFKAVIYTIGFRRGRVLFSV